MVQRTRAKASKRKTKKVTTRRPVKVTKRKVPKVTKKKVAKVTKRKAPKKKAAKKAVRRRPAPKFADDYRRGDGRILVPNNRRNSTPRPVAPSKIQEGVRKARSELQGVLNALYDLSDGLAVSSIELEVSFSADGKFLGVGIGGATSIKVTFSPLEHDD